jgi:hypothetical protein
MDAPTIIALIIAIIALGGLLFLLVERQKARRLKSRFGPEYERAVAETGSARRACAILDQRQKRVASYQLRQLSPEERNRFIAEWQNVKQRFVDDPLDAINRADSLITNAIRTCGYPAGDFEMQAADLSVQHPHVLTDYRIAHEIMLQSAGGQATTEDLRRAMQHYRKLFEDITDGGWIREEVPSARLAS